MIDEYHVPLPFLRASVPVLHEATHYDTSPHLASIISHSMPISRPFRPNVSQKSIKTERVFPLCLPLCSHSWPLHMVGMSWWDVLVGCLGWDVLGGMSRSGCLARYGWSRMDFVRHDLAMPPGEIHALRSNCPIPLDSDNSSFRSLTTAPTLVLGSTQSIESIDVDRCDELGIDIVRRRSGGGAVLVSDDDLVWFDLVIGPTTRCGCPMSVARSSGSAKRVNDRSSRSVSKPRCISETCALTDGRRRSASPALGRASCWGMDARSSGSPNAGRATSRASRSPSCDGGAVLPTPRCSGCQTTSGRRLRSNSIVSPPEWMYPAKNFLKPWPVNYPEFGPT